MSARDLYQTIDRRISDALGGSAPLSVVRGKVDSVDVTNRRLAAYVDGNVQSTPGIKYDAALAPTVGDVVLILRRPDGFQLAIAIMDRGEAVDPTPVEFIAASGYTLTTSRSYAQNTPMVIPLTVIEYDTDQMYSAPGSLTVHYSGLYKLTIGSGGVTGANIDSKNAIAWTRAYRNGVPVPMTSANPEDVWLDAGDVLDIRWQWYDAATGMTWVDYQGGSLAVLGYAVQTTTLVKGQAPAGVQAYNSGTQSHSSSGSWLTLTLDSERWDTDGYHSSTVNPSRLTIPAGRSGYYRITGSTLFQNSSTGGRFLKLMKNGTTGLRESGESAVSSAHGARFDISTEAYLSAGDYIEMQGYQDSGGTLTVGHTDANLATTLTLTALSTFPVTATEAPTRSIGAKVRGYGQAVPQNADTAVQGSITEYDTDGFWTSALPGRMTVPANAPSGIYRVYCAIAWVDTTYSGAYRGLRWLRNGAAISPNEQFYSNTFGLDFMNAGLELYLNPGDYVEALAYQNSYTSITIGRNTSPWENNVLSIAYLGSGSAAGTAVEGTEVRRSTAQSIGAGAWAAISFDTETLDQGGWWAVSPNPTRITVARSGWYAYEGKGRWAAPTTAGSQMQLYLQVSGGLVSAVDDATSVSGKYSFVSVSGQVYLTAGQYVELYGQNNDSASKDIDQTYLRLVRMANGAEATLETPVLSDAPGAIIENQTTQVLGTATWSTVQFGTTVRDSHGFVDLANDRFVIPAGHAGLYRVTGLVALAYIAGGNRVLSAVIVNGTQVRGSRADDSGAAGEAFATRATVDVMLNVGDVVTLGAYSAGAGQTISSTSDGGVMSWFAITRLATGPQGPQGDPGIVEAVTGGVVFPATQVPSTDPNTLDDYDEGDWTPAWYSSGGGAAGSIVHAIGRYSKVGRRVKLWASLVARRGTLAAGALYISGLPFQASNTSLTWYAGSVGYFAGFISWTGFQPGVYVNASDQRITLVAQKDGTTVLTDPTVNMPTASDCHIIFQVEYEATT